MPIYALGSRVPNIHPDAFVHPDAVVIGDVVIGAQSSVWPCAVLRGDGATIRIGARTSIQDGCVIHTTDERGTEVGDDCVIGHLVHLEACTVQSNAQVGTGAIVLHRAIVETGAIVAANCVVLNDVVVPSGAIAMGVPAKIREGAADQRMIAVGAAGYVQRAEYFKRALRRID